ncbi:hypothetical protein GSU75_01560 [Pseudomonas savastanoi pv. phaseolicola]|nr:hypothetical protein [Pseudomonas savastanoi pv. phaseolicola]
MNVKILGRLCASGKVIPGVWGATEQKVHISPVPVRKPACRLAGTIKPPFDETASASTTEGNNAPKSGAINSFCKSKFANRGE